MAPLSPPHHIPLQEAACEAVFRHEGVCLALVDAEGRVLRGNRTCCEVLGLTAEALQGLRLQEVAHAEDAGMLDRLLSVLATGQDHAREELRLRHASGRAVWCIAAFSRHLSEDAAAPPRYLVSLQDITPLPLAVAQLRHSVAELASRNRELEDLAHVISHHLREPLRGVFNYVSLLKEGHSPALNAEGRATLDTLLRLARRMDGQLQDLLTLARCGHEELVLAPADMRRLVLEAVENLAALHAERHAHICIPERLPDAVCDEMLVAELWQILIGNALRYNDKDSCQVEIGFAQTSPVVYYVKDNGLGIPRAHQEQIFMLFKRLHSREAYGGGSGAGLAIAQKIVARHGGRLWVDSIPGQGSTFYFTLAGGPACTQKDHPPASPTA